MRFFDIHPVNPQPRLLVQVVDVLRAGGVIVYPTDSSYALGCHLNDKDAVERIRAIRQLDEKHHLSLVCRDLSEIATYAKVDNSAYRLLKALTPGPYTFLLDATREVPRRLQHPKRKTIGIRVPNQRVAQALLAQLGEPLISTTLILPGHEHPLCDVDEIRDHLKHQVDAVISGGPCTPEPTTVVDLTGAVPVVVRAGLGDVSLFES